MSSSKKPTKQPRRRPGRPKRGSEVCTPEAIERIADLWLQGVSTRKIGEALGVNRMTIEHHLDATIRPQWQESMRSRLAEDLARVALLEKIAWQRFESSEPCENVEQVEKALVGGKGRLRLVKQATRSVTRTGETAWLQIIQWCLEYRMRVHGYAAPTRHHVDMGGELRVAGLSPTQVDNAMLTRLHEQILERRRLHPGLGNEPN